MDVHDKFSAQNAHSQSPPFAGHCAVASIGGVNAGERFYFTRGYFFLGQRLMKSSAI
jgi:hypothetical protein